MRILFTGASSFTGYWFVKELAARGHEVSATFRENYTGIRKDRAALLNKLCRPHSPCRFGSDDFLDLLSRSSFDILCHHAACAENYKSPRFDVAKALSNNTHRISEVLSIFKENGGKKIVITGSVFEKGEGAGTGPLRAFSPYGLSKSFTSDIIEYAAGELSLPFGKFVIPNPFGPYEEERFTTWLVKNWAMGKSPEVRTPLYVRDNIHVSLLAKAYVRFIEGNRHRINPSGYVSTQGEFTERFASQMRKYLNLKCDYELLNQTEFPEPMERYNTDPCSGIEWDEKTAWAELADYYRKAFL